MATRRTHAAINMENRTIVLSLAAALAALFVLYGYFIASAVAQVVVRQEIGRDIANAEQQISELETAYIAAEQSLDDTLARQDTYTKVAEKTYLALSENNRTLTLRR